MIHVCLLLTKKNCDASEVFKCMHDDIIMAVMLLFIFFVGQNLANDGIVFKEEERAGIGVIVRDSRGMNIASMIQNVPWSFL
nr:hypothetical protein CFP56_65446 [Quercus suber]